MGGRNTQGERKSEKERRRTRRREMGRLKSMRVLLSPLFTVKKSQAHIHIHIHRPKRGAARCRNKKISARTWKIRLHWIFSSKATSAAFINRSDRACGDARLLEPRRDYVHEFVSRNAPVARKV